MVKTFNRIKQMAAPEWAPSHPSVIAYEFSRADLKRLGQPDNHGAPCRRRLGFKALFEGAQSETVRMRLVPSGRARTAIARLSEVVDSLRKPAVLLARRDFFKALQIGCRRLPNGGRCRRPHRGRRRSGAGLSYRQARRTIRVVARHSGRRKYTSSEYFHPGQTHCFSKTCLLYTSPSPRDRTRSRMPSSA